MHRLLGLPRRTVHDRVQYPSHLLVRLLRPVGDGYRPGPQQLQLVAKHPDGDLELLVAAGAGNQIMEPDIFRAQVSGRASTRSGNASPFT